MAPYRCWFDERTFMDVLATNSLNAGAAAESLTRFLGFRDMKVVRVQLLEFGTLQHVDGTEVLT
jgi:hypothetical protein